MRCRPRKGCRPAVAGNSKGLASLVQLYRRENGARLTEDLEAFRNMPSIGRAVDCAGRAVNEDGKRFDHQRRLRVRTLLGATEALSAILPRLQNCRSFHELHSFVTGACGGIPGIGELYIYDTALRIGAFLGRRPEYVYLHRGTRMGARALGLDVSRPYLHVSDLPKPIRALKPYEIEDFLCIYEEQFRRRGEG